MYPFKNILFCTDFSPLSRSLLKYAAAFARHHQARLYILNVQESSLPPQALRLSERALAENGYEWLVGVRRELEEIAAHEVLKGLDVHVLLTEGDPAVEIPRIAAEKQADLVTLATQRRGLLDRAMMGSTALAVLEHIHCPVLVARQPSHDFVYYKGAETTVALNRILFATDFQKFDDNAKSMAVNLAKEYNAKLTAMHALYVVVGYIRSIAANRSEDIEGILRRDAADKLDAIKTDAAGATVETVLSDGRPYESIIQYATEHETDLIVIGLGERQSGNKVGHNTERVVRETPCPVLIVP